MWEQFFEMAASNGIWAALFVSLFFIQIKDSKTRENKYQEVITSLTDKLSVVLDIKDAVDMIKEKVEE